MKVEINSFLSQIFIHFFDFFLPSMVWNENTEAPKNIKTFIIEDKKNPENAVTSKILNMMETVKDI